MPWYGLPPGAGPGRPAQSRRRSAAFPVHPPTGRPGPGLPGFGCGRARTPPARPPAPAGAGRGSPGPPPPAGCAPAPPVPCRTGAECAPSACSPLPSDLLRSNCFSYGELIPPPPGPNWPTGLRPRPGPLPPSGRGHGAGAARPSGGAPGPAPPAKPAAGRSPGPDCPT